MAIKTVSSFPLNPDWHFGGSTGKLRLYYDRNFTDNQSRPVVGAAAGSEGPYEEVNITIASLVATVATFDLITTEDSSKPGAKVIGVLYDENGGNRGTLFEWSVPPNGTLASPTTFALMEAYNNRNHVINPPTFSMNQAQILAFINAALAAVGIVPATNLVAGIVKLSIAAADPANPIVWGTNDPLVRDALKLLGIPLDALMATPADTNVPVFDAVSGTWKPGVGAQGAAGGDLSGTYPNPSVVDDSHLHSAATIVSIPAHALSHENGGSDEISVAGLSGLLADAQTPLAHATSHQNGGADEISVAGLSGLLADGQTPLAHNTSHQSGGSDAIKLDDLAAPDDNTDLNATTGAHGLLPKLNNSATAFLNGQGAWSTPSGAGDVVGPAGAVDAEIALFDNTTGKLIKRASGTGFVKVASGVFSADANPISGLPAEIQVACSDETTALTTGTAKVTFRMPRAMTVTAVRGSLSTGQTSGSIFTVDVNEGGSSILSTKLTIDNGEKTSTTAATPPVISDSALADDAEITIDIDQVGDGTAKGLKISLIGVWT